MTKFLWVCAAVVFIGLMYLFWPSSPPSPINVPSLSVTVPPKQVPAPKLEPVPIQKPSPIKKAPVEVAPPDRGMYRGPGSADFD
jgi:hypothetical protein